MISVMIPKIQMQGLPDNENESYTIVYSVCIVDERASTKIVTLVDIRQFYKK